MTIQSSLTIKHEVVFDFVLLDILGWGRIFIHLRSLHFVTTSQEKSTSNRELLKIHTSVHKWRAKTRQLKIMCFSWTSHVLQMYRFYLVWSLTYLQTCSLVEPHQEATSLQPSLWKGPEVFCRRCLLDIGVVDCFPRKPSLSLEFIQYVGFTLVLVLVC